MEDDYDYYESEVEFDEYSDQPEVHMSDDDDDSDLLEVVIDQRPRTRQVRPDHPTLLIMNLADQGIFPRPSPRPSQIVQPSDVDILEAVSFINNNSFI